MTAANPTPRPDAGFTLLELLLAVVILGLITATVYGALARTESSKRIAENRAELYSAGRQAITKIANDIEGALPPPSGDRIYFRGTHGIGVAPEIHLVTMNRGGFGMNRVRPGRVLVVYSLVPIPGRRGQYGLLREEYLYKAMLDKADGIEPQSSSFDLDAEADTAQASFLLECETRTTSTCPESCCTATNLILRYYTATRPSATGATTGTAASTTAPPSGACPRPWRSRSSWRTRTAPSTRSTPSSTCRSRAVSRRRLPGAPPSRGQAGQGAQGQGGGQGGGRSGQGDPEP
ncbi:MAG: prepilin-type N-terminal cleavage/methylation domain-containing protein [Candidatus Binatia bacterium]